MRVWLATLVAMDFGFFGLRVSGRGSELKVSRVVRQRCFVIFHVLVDMLVVVPVEGEIIRILRVLESM